MVPMGASENGSLEYFSDRAPEKTDACHRRKENPAVLRFALVRIDLFISFPSYLGQRVPTRESTGGPWIEWWPVRTPGGEPTFNPFPKGRGSGLSI